MVQEVPTINPKSKKISEESMRADGKDGLGNIHQVLYLNAFYRAEEAKKQQDVRQKPTFKPELVAKQSEGTRTLQDILNSKDDYEQNLKMYKDALEEHNSQTLYRPKVGRAP